MKRKPGTKGAEFIVKLDGVHLPPEVQTALAREIQSVTLRELAKLDLGEGLGIRVPRKDWLGIWIRDLRGGGPLPNQLPNLGVVEER
jgi:hypothetical protein